MRPFPQAEQGEAAVVAGQLKLLKLRVVAAAVDSTTPV
jgi:hypothetical protein